jgi:hypothetical protein
VRAFSFLEPSIASLEICRMSRNEDDNVKLEVPTGYGPERRGWHFDKTWSVSDLLIVIVTLIGGIGAYYNLKQDGAIQAAQIQYILQQRAEDRQGTESKLSDLQQQIRTMDSRMTDRLDKIADKVGAK